MNNPKLNPQLLNTYFSLKTSDREYCLEPMLDGNFYFAEYTTTETVLGAPALVGEKQVIEKENVVEFIYKKQKELKGTFEKVSMPELPQATKQDTQEAKPEQEASTTTGTLKERTEYIISGNGTSEEHYNVFNENLTEGDTAELERKCKEGKAAKIVMYMDFEKSQSAISLYTASHVEGVNNKVSAERVSQLTSFVGQAIPTAFLGMVKALVVEHARVSFKREGKQAKSDFSFDGVFAKALLQTAASEYLDEMMKGINKMRDEVVKL